MLHLIYRKFWYASLILHSYPMRSTSKPHLHKNQTKATQKDGFEVIDILAPVLTPIHVNNSAEMQCPSSILVCPKLQTQYFAEISVRRILLRYVEDKRVGNGPRRFELSP